MPPKNKDSLASLLRGVKVDALRDDLVNWRSWALTVRDVLQVQGIYCAAVPADEGIAEILGDPDGDEKDDAQMRRVARLVMLTHMEPTPKAKATQHQPEQTPEAWAYPPGGPLGGGMEGKAPNPGIKKHFFVGGGV